MGSRDVDPAYFFADDVPTYGQRVNPDDVTALAYLRAIRRIDPCGLLEPRRHWPRSAKSARWERFSRSTSATSTSRCPGEASRRYASVEVILNRMAGQTVAFLAGGLPVYETVSRIVRLPAAAQSVIAAGRSTTAPTGSAVRAHRAHRRRELRFRPAPGARNRSDGGIVAAAGARRRRRLSQRAGGAGSLPGAVGDRRARSSAGTSPLASVRVQFRDLAWQRCRADSGVAGAEDV